jgi:ligand-binding sensor domain-containing protein
LWVATNKGLARLRGGRIEPVLVDGRSFAAPASQVGQDTQGRLWVLREDGLYRQQGDLDFQRVPGRPPGRSRALACRGAGGDVFVAVGDGLWERREDGSWVDWSDRGLAQDGIEALAVDKGGRLWVVGGRSLLCLDPGAASFRDLSSWLPAPPFTGCVIEPGGDGSVSIPTNAGLLRIHGSSREVIDDSLGLPCKWTASSLVDREGNLWVLGPRLYRLLGRGYVRSYTAQDGLPNDLVWTALRDPRGTLWAGTSNGLARLGPKGWKAIAGTEGLSVTCLVMDGKGRLWVGANNASLRVLDPGAGRAAPFPLHGLAWNGPAAAFPSRSASLMLDREGALWLGDPGQGIYRLDLERRTIRLEYGPREAGLDDFAVRRFHLDAQGRLWAASNAGLILRDQAGWHQFTKAQGLSETSLQGLAPGGDGSCWVLYHEPVGLTRVAVTGGRLQVLQQLDTAHGLASDRVYSVGVDPKGAVWVGIDRGVERFRGGQGFHISQGGGMPGEDCSGNGIFAEPDGTVWVGTSTGLARILPGQEPPAPGPLRVILTQVLRGKGRLGASLQSLPRLSHRDATLEFRFASPTFVNEKAGIYQVRLLGLEDEWRTTDVPQVRYTALPGGRYRFEVRAAYPGQPFGPPTVYPLEVLPPWWRTWWALGLGLLGTGGAVGTRSTWVTF